MRLLFVPRPRFKSKFPFAPERRPAAVMVKRGPRRLAIEISHTGRIPKHPRGRLREWASVDSSAVRLAFSSKSGESRARPIYRGGTYHRSSGRYGRERRLRRQLMLLDVRTRRLAIGLTFTKESFNVFNTVCCFAHNVASGTFRVPRSRRADSPIIGNSGDFLDVTFLQGPQRGLKAVASRSR